MLRYSSPSAAPGGHRSHRVLWHQSSGTEASTALLCVPLSFQMLTGRGLQAQTGHPHAGPHTRMGRGQRPPLRHAPASASQAAGTGSLAFPPWDEQPQGDGGVNDSFRHLHPSGDSQGGISAGMACAAFPEAQKETRGKERR